MPKDEGSFDQWMFQVQGALDSHSEEAVRSAIVHSVRGEVRELVRFIGFRAEISTILTGIEGCFGRGPSADKLQQEYYQLQQERGEKGATIHESPGDQILEAERKISRPV